MFIRGLDYVFMEVRGDEKSALYFKKFHDFGLNYHKS